MNANHWVITNHVYAGNRWSPTHALRMFVGDGKHGWWQFDSTSGHAPRNYAKLRRGDIVYLYNGGGRKPWNSFMARAKVQSRWDGRASWPRGWMPDRFNLDDPGEFGLLLERPRPFYEPIALEDLRADPAGKALKFDGFFHGPHGGLENLGSGPGSWEEHPSLARKRGNVIERTDQIALVSARRSVQVRPNDLREHHIETEIRRQLLLRTPRALRDFCNKSRPIFVVAQALSIPVERRGRGPKRHLIDIEIGFPTKETLVEVKATPIVEADVEQLRSYIGGLRGDLPTEEVEGILAGPGWMTTVREGGIRFVSTQPYVDRLIGADQE